MIVLGHVEHRLPSDDAVYLGGAVDSAESAHLEQGLNGEGGEILDGEGTCRHALECG